MQAYVWNTKRLKRFRFSVYSVMEMKILSWELSKKDFDFI